MSVSGLQSEGASYAGMAGMGDTALLDCYVRVEEPRALQAASLVNEVRSLDHLTPYNREWLLCGPTDTVLNLSLAHRLT